MTFQTVMNAISLWILPVILITILTVAMLKKVPVYEAFTDGAKDGFKVAVGIIPYLVAIMVAISMLRASGFIDSCATLLNGILTKISVPVDVLPIMIVRSLSGSAALGIFSDIANHFPADSYVVKLSAIIVGSSETTFYVLAVYFGSVGISKVRYALATGIIADIIGILAAILVAHQFFL